MVPTASSRFGLLEFVPAASLECYSDWQATVQTQEMCCQGTARGLCVTWLVMTMTGCWQGDFGICITRTLALLLPGTNWCNPPDSSGSDFAKVLYSFQIPSRAMSWLMRLQRSETDPIISVATAEKLSDIYIGNIGHLLYAISRFIPRHRNVAVTSIPLETMFVVQPWHCSKSSLASGTMWAQSWLQSWSLVFVALLRAR